MLVVYLFSLSINHYWFLQRVTDSGKKLRIKGHLHYYFSEFFAFRTFQFFLGLFPCLLGFAALLHSLLFCCHIFVCNVYAKLLFAFET